MMKLASGEIVKDRFNSHLNENVKSILPDVLKKISSDGRQFIEAEVELGRVVGCSICVPTTDRDEIIYEQRPHRGGKTRFVKHREPIPCTTVVVVLKRDETKPNCYILITAFFGSKPEPEPWDEKAFMFKPNPDEARQKSIDFWNSHALVL